MAEDSVTSRLTHLVPTRVVEFTNDLRHFHDLTTVVRVSVLDQVCVDIGHAMRSHQRRRFHFDTLRR
jgi:hypothetical protein